MRKNRWKRAVDRMKRKQLFFVVDSYGRVHCNVSNLPKKLRPYLRYHGRPLVNVDLKNSHPYFLALEVRDTYAVLPDDAMLFVELVTDGMIYEYLRDHQQTANAVWNRDDAKINFLMAINAKQNMFVEMNRLIERLFPSVYNVIKDKKKRNHAHLSHLLQRKESSFIFDEVCSCLMPAPMLTIHDSIMTTGDNADNIAETIVTKATQMFELSPKVEVEQT